MEVKRSSELSNDFIYEILEIDKETYDTDLLGDFDSLNGRLQASLESYLLLYDQENLIGYITFFPISDDLYEKITTLDMVFDDNIEPADLVPYSDNYHLYLLSIVIKKSHRDKDGIKLLLAEFTSFLKEKEKLGYRLSEITALAVSDDGQKLLNSIGLSKRKSIKNKYSLYSGKFKEVQN